VLRLPHLRGSFAFADSSDTGRSGAWVFLQLNLTTGVVVEVVKVEFARKGGFVRCGTM